MDVDRLVPGIWIAVLDPNAWTRFARLKKMIEKKVDRVRTEMFVVQGPSVFQRHWTTIFAAVNLAWFQDFVQKMDAFQDVLAIAIASLDFSVMESDVYGVQVL